MMRRIEILERFGLAVLVVGLAATRLGAQVRNSSGNLLTEAGIEQKLDAQVPLDLVFNDESGREVRLRDLTDGKPILLNLVYFECPRLCKLTLDGLMTGLRELDFDVGKEFTVLTVSFDPREDHRIAAGAKRTALTIYGREGAAKGWRFLTGSRESIQKLTESVGFQVAYDPAIDQFAHAAGLVILTPDGRVARYLSGIQYAPRDLRLALVEASQGKIGSPTDQVLLMCYQYNPSIGKYGWAIQRVICILGLSTVAAIAGGIFVLLWRERRLNALNGPGLEKTKMGAWEGGSQDEGF